MIPDLQFYKYTGTYAGAPVNEVAQSLENSARTFDKNLDENNKVQTFFASIKALPGDKEYLAQKATEASNIIKEVADKDGIDRWDLAGDKIQRLKASVTQDPKLNAVRESYLNFVEGEKTKQEMRAKGIEPLEFSDIRSHRSFDDDGNVNIYQPNIVQKADYVATADSILKEIAPDLYETNLQPSEIDGILQGKIVRGISREKLLSKLDAVKVAYDNTNEGRQHRMFLDKYSPGVNKDDFIKNFLFSIGTIRTFNEEKTTRMVDPSFAIEERGRQRMEEIYLKDQLKRARGNGNYDPSQEGLFSIQTLKGKGEVGKERRIGNGLMFANPLIGSNLGEAVWTGDNTRVVQINKKGENSFNPDEHTIVKFKPKGYAMDDSEGAGTTGGMIGDAFYIGEDGKEKPIQIVLKNSDPEIVNAFSTYNSLSNVLRTQSKGDKESYKNKSVVDTSGLFDFTGKKIHLKVFSDNSISPVLETKEGKFEVPTDSVLKDLMLKRNYTMPDIQNMIISKIAPKVLPYTQTASQINK